MYRSKDEDLMTSEFLMLATFHHSLSLVVVIYINLSHQQMTNLEKAQPRNTFFEAGRHAFMIGISFGDNPYKEHPFKTLWEKGHLAGQRRLYPIRRRPNKEVRFEKFR